MTTTGRTASGTVNTAEESMLATTIPYDSGWKAKIDGEKVPDEAISKMHFDDRSS